MVQRRTGIKGVYHKWAYIFLMVEFNQGGSATNGAARLFGSGALSPPLPLFDDLNMSSFSAQRLGAAQPRRGNADRAKTTLGMRKNIEL